MTVSGTSAVRRSRVIHRGEHAENAQVWIQSTHHLVDGVLQQGNAAQSEVLGLHRDNDVTTGRQSVDGQQANDGWQSISTMS